MAEASPMMEQYIDLKNQNKEKILFYQLGDFYEMFYDDAILVSKELDLTLTVRDCGRGDKAPMCGVPTHSCEAYIARLIAKGYKIVVCNQMGDPSKTKGIITREVVRVITPGTVVEASMLDESKNNYICSLFLMDDKAGIAFCDVSTGQLKVTELSGDDIIKEVQSELGKFLPKELLVGGTISLLEPLRDFVKNKLSCSTEYPVEEDFDILASKDKILKHFSQEVIDDSGINDMELPTRCIGALLCYLEATQKAGLERINKIEVYTGTKYMKLDLTTIKNLELLETIRNKEKKGSLIWVLDKTRTAMGKRLLRSWIERPLVDCKEISKRQDAIEKMYENVMLRDALVEAMIGMHDIERLLTRVTCGSANGRDLRALSDSISKIPALKETIKGQNVEMLLDIYNNMDTLEDINSLISNAITDNPPFSVRDGGIIKDGYSKDVDEARSDMDGGKDIIASMEERERQKTGIPKLKIGYNRISGYYIEVTNSYKNLVPDTYTRKQTLSNCERYVTAELKQLETRIFGAKERCVELEYKIFEEVRTEVCKAMNRITLVAGLVAILDVLNSLAIVAANNNYNRPVVTSKNEIILSESRHPVVESLLKNTPFVPNNAHLDNEENMIAVITGPNMAGKSTYMRQVALVVLMAQIGSFVPAIRAEIGVVDSIFTRIGASDDLASGQSTFMVEMNEVAQIMKSATNKSLLILDEIGRGTSTFDGMSIARAVLEYILDKTKLGAKTLFSTHYHELASMGDEYSEIKNYNIAVKKRGDDITFLRRIVPGGADDSYGIEVAKLAGLPEFIITRAKEILNELESTSATCVERHTKAPDIPKDSADEIGEQVNDNSDKILQELKTMDVTVLTPVECMNTLFDLVKMANA